VSAKSENAAESAAPGPRRHIFTPDTYERIGAGIAHQRQQTIRAFTKIDRMAGQIDFYA
jgi:hypothetical protein